jgi:hypothetical protein
MAPERDPFWIDCLHEKHECWGYDHPQRIQVEHASRQLNIDLPNYLPRMEVKVTAESSDLLFLIGRQTKEYPGLGFPGVLMVARRQAGDTYAAVIWHELYPWALKYLGLEQESPEAQPGTDE